MPKPSLRDSASLSAPSTCTTLPHFEAALATNLACRPGNHPRAHLSKRFPR